MAVVALKDLHHYGERVECTNLRNPPTNVVPSTNLEAADLMSCTIQDV